MSKFTRSLNLFTAIVGIWLIVAPFMYSIQSWAFWNFLIVGVTVVAASAYNLYTLLMTREEVDPNVGRLVMALGIWLLFSIFFIPPRNDEVVLYNSIVVGIFILVPGVIEQFIGSHTRQDEAGLKKNTVEV